MTLEERFNLIKKNTEEILTEKELKNLLRKKKNISAYYGTAPTGPFHIGYLIPLSKVFDFEKAGIKTKILIADIHAALDDQKTKWVDLKKRAEYYKKCIKLAFPWKESPQIVMGSSFQLSKEYILDVLKLSSFSTVTRAKRAASEVTRMKEPKVSELIYPIMQSLDEEYLKADIQLGGIDQRHILAFARTYLPVIGYKKRVEIMTPLLSSLKGPGTKMSASDPTTHIKIYDSKEEIAKKIQKAYCPEGDVTNNPIIQLAKYLIFPVEGNMYIERTRKFGGSKRYETYEELKQDFVEKRLHPLDLKLSMSDYLSKRFERARNYFKKNDKILKDLGEKFL